MSKAKTSAQRSKKYRDKKRAELARLNGTKFKMLMGAGTCAALDQIIEAGGFEKGEEAISVLIHNAAKLINRDASRFEELVDVKGLSDG